MTLRYSVRSEEVGSASSIQQNEMVYRLKREGKDPIILSYGEAPFKVAPFFADAEDFERGTHYSDSRGVPEFVNEVRGYLERNFGAVVGPENIMVSAGSKIISYLIAVSFLNDGDVMALHEPSWVSYQEHARLSGASTRFHSFEKSLSTLVEEQNFDGRLRLIYINNPNNPRGIVYSQQELRQLAESARSHGIVVAVDESYSDFSEEPFFSCARLVGEFDNVVVFHSLSKNFGLSGWRIGYAVANPEVCQTLNKLNMHLITCAPTVLQLALVNRLEGLQKEIRPQIAELKKKRAAVVDVIQSHGLRVLSGTSTFYLFVDVSKYLSSTKDFALHVLENCGVSIIPGDNYGAHTGGFVRISFANEPIDRINTGIGIMKSQLERFRNG